MIPWERERGMLVPWQFPLHQILECWQPDPIWLPSETSLADDLITSPVAKLGGVMGQAVGSLPGMSSVGRDLRLG